MKRCFAMAALVVVSMTLTGPVVADEFDELTQAVLATENHTAQFKQSFRPHGSEIGMAEAGTVVFGVLPKMRWSYQSPEKKVFVFDGTTSWLYVEADKQLSLHELTASEKAELPFLLLKDESRARQSFRLSSTRSAGTVTYRLEPRAAGQIRGLSVLVDTKSQAIRAIEYEDREGNRTRFDFEKFRAVSPGPGTFRFDAPADVEVVEY